MVRIKICGLQSAEHACIAAEAGADFLGMVFVPNVRRAVQGKQARTIIAEVRAAGYQTPFVGLFVNARAGAIRHVVEEIGLEAIQLSGHEPVSMLSTLPPVPIFKAIRFADDPQEPAWIQHALTNPSVKLLVDAHVAGAYGGTGALGNWQQARTLATTHQILLAGGLSPSNVAQAIATVQPWAVDVSSGIETDGVKDPMKIRAFIQNGRSVATGQP